MTCLSKYILRIRKPNFHLFSEVKQMYQNIKQSISYIIEHVTADKLDSFLISQYSSNNNDYCDIEDLQKNTSFYEEETHKFFEAALVLEGSFILHIGHDSYIIQKNQICLIDRDTLHQIGWRQSSPEDLSILWIACIGKSLRMHITLYQPDCALKQFGCDLFNTDDFLLNEIYRELKERQTGYREAVVSFLISYLTLIFRRLDHSVISKGVDWKSRIISETQKYIADHLNAKLSLGEISNAVSISPSYLSLFFKQVAGYNISEYILDTRINKAMELLGSTEYKLSDIAEMLGFYDQFYFSKVFKQYTGISPSSYRNKLL